MDSALSMPPPRADHVGFRHTAMFFARTAAGGGEVAGGAETVPPPSSWIAMPRPAGGPAPGAVQVEPSHLARKLADVPPAFVKKPPTKSAGPEPSSKTTRLLT
jgi:hypothetical protein